MILTRKYEKDLQLNWPLKYDTVFTNWPSSKSVNCSCHKIDLCLLWRWLPLACAWYKSQFSRYYCARALSAVNLRHTYFIYFNTVKSSLNYYNSIKNKFTHKYPSNRCPAVAIKCRYDDRCKCRHNTIETKTWKKIQALNGIRIHDLCDTGAMLSHLSYQTHLRTLFYKISVL